MFKGWRVSFVRPYHPAGRRRFFSRYRNGVTFRLGSTGLHIWRVVS